MNETQTQTQTAEAGDVTTVERENRELRAYLKAFCRATIEPEENGKDVGVHEANPTIVWTFRHEDEQDVCGGRYITGGQVRRAMELVGFDKLATEPATRTIADDLAETAGLRRRVVALESAVKAYAGSEAQLVAKLEAALAASPAPRAPAAVPEELRAAACKVSAEFAKCSGMSFSLIGAMHDLNTALRRTLAAAPAAPPADGGAEGLREALDYLRMPDVTDTKYAVVPVEGDRDALAVVEAHITALTTQRDEARADREGLTKALTGLTCGGSEFFSRRGDAFIADVGACVTYVRRLRTEAHEGRVVAIRAQKAAEARVAELEAALSSRTPAGAAGDPVGEDGRPVGVMEAEWIKRLDEQASAMDESEVAFFSELKRLENDAHVRNLHSIKRSYDAEGICTKCLDAALAALATRTPAGAAGDPVGQRIDFPGDRFEGDLTLVEAAMEVINWHAKDGSAGTLNDYIADLRSALARHEATRPASPAPAASAGRGDDLPQDLYRELTHIYEGFAHIEEIASFAREYVSSIFRWRKRIASEAALAPAAQVNPGRDLPDDIRVPLHELQADTDYLFGRVAADGSCAGVMAASVKAKLKALEDAILAARPVAEGDAETLETIAKWCEATFGPIQPDRIVSRAAEEMDELRAEPTRVEEAADIVIVLARYPGLWTEIQRKMKINRGRRWRLMGDGTGYHIKDEAAARPAPSPAKGGNADAQ